MTPGSAGKLLTIADEGDPASDVIHNIAENRASTIRLLEPVTLGDISIKMQTGLSFVMPRVVEEKGQLQIEGASVIKTSDNMQIYRLLISRR